jgi:hypothetical protein
MRHLQRKLVATVTAVMILIAGVPGCICANCSNRAKAAPAASNDKGCHCCSNKSGDGNGCCCKDKNRSTSSVEACSCSTKAPTAPAPVTSTTLLNLQLTFAALAVTVSELPDTGEECSALLLGMHDVTPLPADRLIALQHFLL